MLHFSKVKIAFIALVCCTAVAFALPSFLNDENPIKNALPNSKINLGLDLRGGSQLLLEANFNYYVEEKLKNLRNDLRDALKKDKIRASVKKNKKKIIISFFSNSEKKPVKKIIFQTDKNLETEENSDNIIVEFSKTELAKMRRDLISQSIEIIRRRIDENGTKEPTIQAQGKKRILLQVPGAHDSGEVKRLLGKTAKMTFHFVSDESFSSAKISNPNLMAIRGGNEATYFVEKDVALSGDLLIDANPTYHEGYPAVSFRFNQSGTKKFAKITSENIGRIFAIVLDNRVITAPKINSIINQGNGVITGDFTTKEASDLALLLRAGALPAPLKIIEERSIGPSLGLDSIKSGTFASITSLVLIAATMLFFYTRFGLIANFALIFNISIILAILSLMQATLTLPGIAGIALTMGMSVDANVLIFERIKEELRAKQSVLSALENGFSQAFRTIIDSNITTLIIALFLYMFGTGPVKGFAVTLSIGILSSMFCAILLTRLIIVTWVKKSKPKKLSLS